MFLAGNFPVSGGSIETCVPEVFLKQPHSFSAVINFHSVYGKGVPESMGGDIVDFPRLRINQFRQFSFFGTFPYDLPGSMPVYSKYQMPTILFDRPTPADILPHHA